MRDPRIGRCTIAVCMLEPFSSETVDSGEVLYSAASEAAEKDYDPAEMCRWTHVTKPR